jgi:hypothetical protein
LHMASAHTPPDGRPERRANRLELPPCRKCRSPSVKVHDRTEDALVLTCMACDDRSIVPKPKPAP